MEKWIAAKSLEIPSLKYATLLQVAVETGFHSLIELIAKKGNNQQSKNAALADAVSLHRLDFAQLLVKNGAEVSSVPLADVLLEWNPQIIRFFLDHGADPLEGSPFAVAFRERSGRHWVYSSNSSGRVLNYQPRCKSRQIPLSDISATRAT